jgi:uncharacterized iron-regulated protein
VDEAAVLDELSRTKVVYVAEQHDNPRHHALQLYVLTQLVRRDPSVAVGMEMFQRPFQAALNDYVGLGASPPIDEEELLRRTEYAERWGFDFALYRPILRFARDHKLSVVALNAPRELTRKVAQGGLAALTPGERITLPTLDLSDVEHRRYARLAFHSHGAPEPAHLPMGRARLPSATHGRGGRPHGGHAGSFDNFYAVQVLWDETMATAVATTLSSPAAPRRLVVLAGEGHIRAGVGIPKRAARRKAAPFRTVAPVVLEPSGPPLAERLAELQVDYVWVMSLSPNRLPR